MTTVCGKLKRIWGVVILLGMLATAQAQVARIITNMDHFSRHPDTASQGYKRVMEMEWRIHGQALHFGDDTLRIPVDAVLDTVFYRRDLRSQWDTMITSFDRPKVVSFLYNECCGAFSVSDSTKSRLVQASVQFRLTGNPGKRLYIGKLSDDGALLAAGKTVMVNPVCHSAVVPNIFMVSVAEILPCQPEDSCENGACLVVEGEKEPRYDFSFKSLTKLTNFLYLPIDERPLVVTYDIRRRKITIE